MLTGEIREGLHRRENQNVTHEKVYQVKKSLYLVSGGGTLAPFSLASSTAVSPVGRQKPVARVHRGPKWALKSTNSTTNEAEGSPPHSAAGGWATSGRRVGRRQLGPFRLSRSCNVASATVADGHPASFPNPGGKYNKRVRLRPSTRRGGSSVEHGVWSLWHSP